MTSQCFTVARLGQMNPEPIPPSQRPVSRPSNWQENPKREPELRPDTECVHTPTMTLKTAALLAVIGTILMTVLSVWAFVSHVVNVLRGLVPAVTVFSSFVYAFAWFSVAVFFCLFHRAQ